MESKSPPEDFNVASIELYMSRTSLFQANFEQYQLSPDLAFVECGEVRRGRHVPQQQNIISIPEDAYDRISEASWHVVEAVDRMTIDFDPPGTDKSLFDPGRLSLSIALDSRATEVKTSVDSVSLASSAKERNVLKLVKLIRGAVGTNHCGLGEFYGIGQDEK